MKKFVISAVNINEGGALTALKACLAALQGALDNSWEIHAIVHNKSLFANNERIFFHDYPASKRSWLLRLYYEWFFFRRLSKRIKPDIWFSFHDITPNVFSKKQIVYCHNPAPFFKMSWKDIYFEPKLYIFNKLYSFFYKINLKKNDFVVVQQNWLRQEFLSRFNPKKVIVARPETSGHLMATKKNIAQPFTFFYPSFPRAFKNIELICQAVEKLTESGNQNFRVLLTIDGTENKYSRHLLSRYAHLKQIKFLGRLTHEEVVRYYGEINCLLFPSRLETWGLPISEAKQFDLPILAADLPYAHETIGDYSKVKFFPPQNERVLATYMQEVSEDALVFDVNNVTSLTQSDAHSWNDLIKLMIK